MNVRQKLKKYRHMYEKLLSNQPIKLNVVQHKIDTLRFERFYPEELVTKENSSYLKEVIVKDIAYDIARSLNKYAEYYTEFCPHINGYRLYGEIKVVSRL